MRKRTFPHGALLGLVLVAALPALALAGKDYIAARKLLKRGDAKGLEAMEKVCKKEPFASNAWLDLAKGYLRIKRDPAKAMDAAVRGLEKYSEKWQYKVPKKSLYGVFSQAAVKAKPEDLRKYLPRIEKLAKRDGALGRPLLTRYARHLPRNALKGVLAQAKALEARGDLGGALKAYEELVKSAKEAGLEGDFGAAVKHGEGLIATAKKELDGALALAKAAKYAECFAALENVSRKYRGHVVGKQAAEKLASLKGSDEVKAAKAAAEQKVREEQAGKILAEARAHLEKKEYVKAAGLLRRVTYLKGTAAARAAAEELKKVEKNPEAAAKLKEAEAESKCRSMLSMAKTLILNGMKDKARAKLNDIIRNYPDTKWAKEAEKLKASL